NLLQALGERHATDSDRDLVADPKLPRAGDEVRRLRQLQAHPGDRGALLQRLVDPLVHHGRVVAVACVAERLELPAQAGLQIGVRLLAQQAQDTLALAAGHRAGDRGAAPRQAIAVQDAGLLGDHLRDLARLPDVHLQARRVGVLLHPDLDPGLDNAGAVLHGDQSVVQALEAQPALHLRTAALRLRHVDRQTETLDAILLQGGQQYGLGVVVQRPVRARGVLLVDVVVRYDPPQYVLE